MIDKLAFWAVIMALGTGVCMLRFSFIGIDLNSAPGVVLGGMAGL